MSTSPPLPADIRRTVAQALAEDIGDGDITARLIPADTRAKAQVISRETMTVCGIAWFEAVFHQLEPGIVIQWQVTECQPVAADTVLCTLAGNARSLLSGERCALNFLQTLSGTATLTHEYTELVAGTDVKLLDTRKTLPGLRTVQKYAVRCGGGQNHRMGLYDAFLIKENHILAAGSITAAIRAAREIAPQLPVEVEVENLAELEEALAAGTDSVLLDNFSLADLRTAVALTAGRAKLEASGGVTRATLRSIAETGVDFISIGALTKDVRAVDLSMRFTPALP